MILARSVRHESVESWFGARFIARAFLLRVTLTRPHPFEEFHGVLADPWPEEPLLQLQLNHLSLHVSDLPLLLHLPLVHLPQEIVETTLS
jgi:hypothetical protein